MYRTLRDEIKKTPFTNMNVVLDLDETLIHSQEEINSLINLGLLSKPEFLEVRQRLYVLKFPNSKENMWGITRPYSEDFLAFCFSYFKRVIVWSAGTRDYVDLVVKHLFANVGRQPDLVYSRQECIMTKDKKLGITTCKPLTKLMEQEKWLDLTPENTLFLDDNQQTFSKNVENAIHIPRYLITNKGKSGAGKGRVSVFVEDNRLKELMDWLMKPETYKTKDIRIVDKTGIFSSQ